MRMKIEAEEEINNSRCSGRISLCNNHVLIHNEAPKLTIQSN